MSALQFGAGWPDRLGRRRFLLWLSDVGWCLFDNGYDVEIIRRGAYDEVAVRARLLGWEAHVDDPRGAEWATQRLIGFGPKDVWYRPEPGCPVCQGEGWVAGPDEGRAVVCGCARPPS